MKYIIYMHTFKQTNKSYIGYTGLTLTKRLHKHITNAQSGLDTHFYRAIRKHSPKNIVSKVICECSSKEEALEKEKYYIEYYDTFKNGYNMTIGGDGGWVVPDEKYDEWIRKKSIAISGEKNPTYTGFTDEEILEAAFSYFKKEGQLPKRKWQIYSSEVYGFPKFYSKFRFKKYGSGLKGFVNAMKDLYNLKDDDFKYKRTNSHSKKLSKSLSGKVWYSNEKLKISKQMSKKEIDILNNEEWIKGRKYGTKNN